MEVLEGQVSIFEFVKEDKKSFDFIIFVYKSVSSYKSYKPKEKIKLVKGMKLYSIGYEHSGMKYYDCILKEIKEDMLIVFDNLIGEIKKLPFEDCELGKLRIIPFAPFIKGTKPNDYLNNLDNLKLKDIDLNDYNDEVEAINHLKEIKKYARNKKYIC